MISQKVKVLHVLSALDAGGLENLLMNVYRNIDRDQVEFHFALSHGRKSVYDDEVLVLGGKIYYFDEVNARSSLKLYWRNLSYILKHYGPFDVMHIHSYFFSGVIALIAYVHRVKIRISHSHSTDLGRKQTIFRRVYQGLTRFLIKQFSTHMLGCSEMACKYVFGEKNLSRSRVIYAGINASRYIYNPETRTRVRGELGLNNRFIVGHIGRFVDVKNHVFLIDIFREVHARHPDSQLMLVGGGELEDSIKRRVAESGLGESVMFMGIRSDVPELLQAMDLLLLPSLHEGLPVVLIEAQAAGLRCIISDISPLYEANLTGLIDYVGLDKSAAYWAEEVIRKRAASRENTYSAICEAGYDIHSTAQVLLDIYHGGASSEYSLDDHPLGAQTSP